MMGTAGSTELGRSPTHRPSQSKYQDRSIALLITQDKKISERFPSLPISEPLLVPMSEDGIYS